MSNPLYVSRPDTKSVLKKSRWPSFSLISRTTRKISRFLSTVLVSQTSLEQVFHMCAAAKATRKLQASDPDLEALLVCIDCILRER
jgi:hypothetical protein